MLQPPHSRTARHAVSRLRHAVASVAPFCAVAFGGVAHAADNRTVVERLQPAEVSITAGSFFPGFLIYEFPGPVIGSEVAWRTGSNTSLVANVGVGTTWISGSSRVFLPVGLTLRVTPWQRGPLWIQAGVGSMPWLESVRFEMPERTVSETSFGATLTTKIALGVSVKGWELGVGSDANVLPSPFYSTYTGDQAVPWNNTFVAWIGRRVWRKQP